MHLLITSKQPARAIDLCEKHRVKMTEDMAERLTDLLPDKEADAEGTRTVPSATSVSGLKLLVYLALSC